MEYTAARVSHLLVVVHALLRWAKGQALHTNRCAFGAAGRRSAPDRSISSSVTSTSERLRAMGQIARHKKMKRNMERESRSKKSEFDFNVNWNRGTISEVDREVSLLLRRLSGASVYCCAARPCCCR